MALRGSTKILTLIFAAGSLTSLTVVCSPVAEATPLSSASTVASRPTALSILSTTRGFQSLIDSVSTQVHSQFPDAQLMEIDGSAPSGKVKQVYGVTSWRFVYNASVGDSLYVVFAEVDLPDTQARISVQAGVWVGSLQVTQPVTMSPLKASVLLRVAGYREPFSYVTYRQPIAGGFTAHPLFIFDQGSGFVGVDTVTGKVAPLS